MLQGFLDNFDPMNMPELNEEMVPVDRFQPARGHVDSATPKQMCSLTSAF